MVRASAHMAAPGTQKSGVQKLGVQKPVLKIDWPYAKPQWWAPSPGKSSTMNSEIPRPSMTRADQTVVLDMLCRSQRITTATCRT